MDVEESHKVLVLQSQLGEGLDELRRLRIQPVLAPGMSCLDHLGGRPFGSQAGSSTSLSFCVAALAAKKRPTSLAATAGAISSSPIAGLSNDQAAQGSPEQCVTTSEVHAWVFAGDPAVLTGTRCSEAESSLAGGCLLLQCILFRMHATDMLLCSRPMHGHPLIAENTMRTKPSGKVCMMQCLLPVSAAQTCKLLVINKKHAKCPTKRPGTNAPYATPHEQEVPVLHAHWSDSPVFC